MLYVRPSQQLGNGRHEIFEGTTSNVMYVPHMCTHVVTSSKPDSTEWTDVHNTHVFLLHMPACVANICVRFTTNFTLEPEALICWNLFKEVTGFLKVTSKEVDYQSIDV